MNIILLIITLIVLAFDSFSITLSKGASVARDSLKQNLTICFLFTFAQMGTLSVGYIGGALIQSVFSTVAELFGIIVLVLIGLKMISGGLKSSDEKELPEKFNMKEWSILAIIASLDSLAMGITFKTVNIGLLEPLILIAIITFILSGSGIILGEKLNDVVGNKFKTIGGVFLVILAISMLLGII